MADQAPVIHFARFVDGKIQLFEGSTQSLKYVAVSHVWGKAEWQPVGGLHNDVLVSKKKALFIEERLPAMVKDTAFWMDVVCVNQRNKSDVVAVTQHIPSIFRKAIWTMAIREGDGLYDCCAAAAEGFLEWEDLHEKMHEHAWKHYGELNTESYLQRLWTLQECLLSRTIRFVTIDQEIIKLDNASSVLDTNHCQADYNRVLDALYVLAHSFMAEGDGVKSLPVMYDFMRAYLSNGTVSGGVSAVRLNDEDTDIHTGYFQTMNRVSNRKATKSRDYIFATMPQFPWYQLPADAKSMNFNAIFSNYHHQAVNSGHGFAFRFTNSMTDPSCNDLTLAWKPSQQQPEPKCLGDFLKLIGERWSGLGNMESCFFTTSVTLRTFPTDLHFEKAISLVETSMIFSAHTWALSHQGGELSEYGSDVSREIKDLNLVVELAMRPGNPVTPERNALVAGIREKLEEVRRMQASDSWMYPQARKILDYQWCSVNPIQINEVMSSSWHLSKAMAQSFWTSRLQHIYLLLAAMVSCQVPLSALAWADEHFVPVLLEFSDIEILGLLAKHVETKGMVQAGQTFLCVGRHFDNEASGMDLLLVDCASKVPVGLIPDFLHRNRTDAEYVRRMRILYHDLQPEVSPRGCAIRRVPLDAIKVRSTSSAALI